MMVIYTFVQMLAIFLRGVRSMPNDDSKVTLKDINAAAERLKNWGRWGPTTRSARSQHFPARYRQCRAAHSQRESFLVGAEFDSNGPQNGLWGNRFNPIHTMLATGRTR